ncbi:hypothetical protein LPJ53_004833 [Coemansia erecta]|uniref:DDHD domain-containing protein n=1 Tax=Coemansia erecta TaxID=147472 RepID=A0A9W7XTL3_9FUNG|nr:hypothetical protein LPJ53_004833 [Coemansia erecta]
MRTGSGFFGSVTTLAGSGSATLTSSSSSVSGDSPPPTHLVILVPGTGPHREDEKPKGMFMRKAHKYRQQFRDTCRRHFPAAAVEMVPIEYHYDMHGLETANRRMAKATLPSIPWIRTMDNEVIGDILYYFSTFHGRAMLAMVIGKLNAAYAAFAADHAGFAGPVSLVAHSLGGIICYEILYCMAQRRRGGSFAANIELERYRDLPELQFAPDRLFTLGSPIGGTMVFRNLTMDAFHMGAVGYHNIFHPFDPFGYRTEPLHDDRYADEPAVPVTAAAAAAAAAAPAAAGRMRRRASLGSSVADLGKNVRDAVVLAPVTLYEAVRARATAGGHRRTHGRRRSLLAPLFAPADRSPDGSAGGSRRHSVSRLLGFRSLSLGFSHHGHGHGHASSRTPPEPRDESSSASPRPAASSEKKAEPRRENALDATAPDDMLGQLLRIFGPSRPPDRTQQLAESQGLPLASRLLAAAHGQQAAGNGSGGGVTRGGVELRATNTVPLDVNGLLACPPALDRADATAALPEAPVCAVHVGRHTPRRTRSLPDGELLGAYAALAAAGAADAAAGTAAGSPGPPGPQQIAQGARSSTAPAATPEPRLPPLPYAERMDYIIPFTKRHLQNEYWLGFHAHFSYWTSKDVVYHILHHMILNPASALA